MQCPNCSKTIPDGVRYCAYCGAVACSWLEEQLYLWQPWWGMLLIIVLILAVVGFWSWMILS